MKIILKYTFFVLFAFSIDTVYCQPSASDLSIGKIFYKDSISKKIDTTTFLVKFNVSNKDIADIKNANDQVDSFYVDTSYLKIQHIYGRPASSIMLNLEYYPDYILLIRHNGMTMTIKLKDVYPYNHYSISSIPFQRGEFQFDSLSNKNKLHPGALYLDITPVNWNDYKTK